MNDEEVANWLLNNPGFFSKHPDVLSFLELKSNYGEGTISLIEKQIEILRKKNKNLELKIEQISQISQNSFTNVIILNKILAWVLDVLNNKANNSFIIHCTESLRRYFTLTHVELFFFDKDLELSLMNKDLDKNKLKNEKLNCTNEQFKLLNTFSVDTKPYNANFGDINLEDLKIFAKSLVVPYCGENRGFSVISSIKDFEKITSLAIVPIANENDILALLILGSTDKTKFLPDMEVDFLEQIAELMLAFFNII